MALTSSRTISISRVRFNLLGDVLRELLTIYGGAAPAGTRVAAAAAITKELARRNSSFKRYDAVPGSSDFKELEQTISASLSVRCAGVCLSGRIS
jgi:hypothetical protein